MCYTKEYISFLSLQNNPFSSYVLFKCCSKGFQQLYIFMKITKFTVWLLFLTVLFFTTGCNNGYDDSELTGRVENIENKVRKLEEQMNSNISSLQSIIEALNNNDYITSITPIIEGGKEIGYTIFFKKGNPIIIYHGQDGQDGYTPQIGVKQDTDGLYYWTLDGEWMTDEGGNKIKAQGIDGLDGFIPQLKIEDKYWWVSYNNGVNWTKLGQATGEDGIDGDSMFAKVDTESSEDYVIFTLSNGTQIKLPTWSAEIVDTIIKYDNVHSDNITESGELIIDEIPDNKNYYGIGCSFNCSDMGTIKIYKSQNDYCRGEINIDATNITEFGNGGEETVIPHGLTITNGLIVSIIKGTTSTNITLTNTAGKKITKQLTKWNGCKGGKIKFIAVIGTYSNVTLSHSGTWMDKDTWIFGDSYTDFWPSKCYANGGTNFYLDGYSGRNAQGGYDSLLKALKYGKPKRIVWMLGMNNADTETAVNESWNNVFNQLKKLCKNLHIQLILCTIPNVPERIHTFKNQIIRESGLPYIDISSALGANEKGSSWFEGLLGSDKVHPTDLGSEVIANTLIAGVPDIVE